MVEDSVLFFGLCIATFLGFVLKAVNNYDSRRDRIMDSPLFGTVMQIIFLSLITILWLVLMFK